MKAGKIIRRMVWLVLLLAVAWLAMRGGRQAARLGWFRSVAAPPPSAQHGRAGAADTANPERRAVRRDVVEQALEKLRAISAGSSNPQYDWEARARMDAALEGLSAEELEELFLTVARGELADYTLILKIGAKWAALDPGAALAAARNVSRTYGSFHTHRIFIEWSADHPREALAWLDAGALPPELEAMKEDFRSAVVLPLAERDFTLAVGELEKMGPQEAQSMLASWGTTYLTDPVMREKLMARAKEFEDPAYFAALNRSLVHKWPEDDPLGLMHHLEDLRRYLESGTVPEKTLPRAEAAAVGTALYREYHDVALEWWMVRHGQSRETPVELRQAVSEWYRYKPELAIGWLEAQPESPQRDSLAAAMIPTMISDGKYQQAVETLRGIRDPELAEAAARRLEIVWGMKDAAAMKAWKDGR